MATINSKKAGNTKKTADPVKEELLADAGVKSLVGHTNVIYYNADIAAWNKSRYNGFVLGDMELENKRLKEFLPLIQTADFKQRYMFVSPVTMTIASEFYPGFGKTINRPKYSKSGAAVVGNIIVKNRKTRELELYCSGWVGVYDYKDDRDDAAVDGMCHFLNVAGWQPDFCAAIHAAHIR